MDKRDEILTLQRMLEDPEYRRYFIDKHIRLEEEICKLPEIMRQAIKEVFFQMDMRKMLREENEKES